jgi:hypothetical protein
MAALISSSSLFDNDVVRRDEELIARMTNVKSLSEVDLARVPDVMKRELEINKKTILLGFDNVIQCWWMLYS